MRLTRSFWAIILLFTVLNACEEIGPAINFEPDYIGFGDTTYMESPSAPEPRVVLFEEFTGVRCTNCVLGHDEAQKMLNRHPNNLISVGLHTGFFAPPIPNKSNYDFRTPQASAIETLIGNQSYPSGMVNRKLFTGENIIPLELNKWESYVTAEISQAPAVNIEL